MTRFVSAQNHYSLLERRVEAQLTPACVKYAVGILPYFPLANGLLFVLVCLAILRRLADGGFERRGCGNIEGVNFRKVRRDCPFFLNLFGVHEFLAILHRALGSNQMAAIRR